jgi:hypothetical protein
MDKSGMVAAVYTVPEVCRMFRINRNLGYELARTGQLPVLRLGRRLVCPKAAIDRMLNEASNAPALVRNDE